jgi:hypothetical protein
MTGFSQATSMKGSKIMKTSASNSTPAEDFSLVLGGPLYQMYLRTRLLKPAVELAERRIIAFVVVTWLPLLVLSIASGTAFGGLKVPFLVDLDVHARFLLALPLLIGAEAFVYVPMRLAVTPFVDRGIIGPQNRSRFDEIVTSTMRVRNSAAIEVALLVAAATLGYWFWRENARLHVDTWYATVAREGGFQLTLVGYWYAFVSLTLFRFILARWYFRLGLWYVFLWRVSRLSLRLNPLHPDRTGGLGFLNHSVFAFAPVLSAQSTLLAGFIGSRIWHEGMTLPAYRLEILGLIVLLMLVILAPLTFFVVPLSRGKRAGLHDYGLLAMQYVDDFHEKWMRGARADGEPLVGSADIQSLADLAGGHDVLREMRLFPVNRQLLVSLAAVIALPFLPLTLTMFPLEEMVNRLFAKLL